MQRACSMVRSCAGAAFRLGVLLSGCQGLVGSSAMRGSSRRLLRSCPARPTSPALGRAVSRRVRLVVRATRLAHRAVLRLGSASLVRSKALGLLHSSHAKPGLALTQRSTRTQPLGFAVRFRVCASSSLFRVRLAAGPVNFHR